jgi:hypothetical protein
MREKMANQSTKVTKYSEYTVKSMRQNKIKFSKALLSEYTSKDSQ